jgi:hypothetical protein
MKKSLLFIFFILTSYSVFCQNNKDSKRKKSGLTISLPYLNNYKFYHHEKNKDSSISGFAGIGFAFFTKTGKMKFSINCGATTDSPYPIGPVNIKPDGDYVRISSIFFEPVFHQNIIKKVNFIYGVNFTAYRYRFTNFNTGIQYKKSDKTVGITTGVEYVFKEKFSIAALYKPSVISFDHKSYKHLLILDFRFDINIRDK